MSNTNIFYDKRSRSGKTVAIELYRYGVVDVITKPLDMNKTLEIIAEALRKE